MTDCWILYDRDDLAINGFFADRLVECGRGLGMDAEIVTLDSIPDGVPDILVNRSRSSEVASRLESRGTVALNSSRVTRIANDKYGTYRLAGSLGIPFLPISLPDEGLPPGDRWVVKSRTGHGGTEVFLADSEEMVRELTGRVRDPIVQTASSTLGRDMRVYVLDGKILAAVMRSNDSDFRANYKLGGDIRLCDVPDDARETVERVCSELHPDLVGIDFVFSDGRAMLNEVEDAVGTRMLYALTELDPARLLMELAHSKMSL